MSLKVARDAQHTEHHLKRMMSKEKQSGDFFLAAVIQDSLLPNLSHHAESSELMQIAHHTSELAVQSVTETMDVNEFAVVETIRGVMHTMVSLGGDPVQMAVAIYMGGWTGVQRLIRSERNLYAKAVASGILSAAEDLGIRMDGVRTVTDYMTAHIQTSHFQ